MDSGTPDAEGAGAGGAGAAGAGPDGAGGAGGAAGAGLKGGRRRAGLFLLAFGSGFAVLTIEITGARLIAPVFGLSAVPWTAVIGVILAALAVGSHLGGRLADAGRAPLSVVLAAAGLTGGLPLLFGGLPWIARDAIGFIPGAMASALILFAPPVLCLGAVVPFLVQADTESLGSVGRRAGDVSAAATAGSIAGTFVTGFLLLPAFPVPVLLGLTSVSLLGLAALSGLILGGPVSKQLLILGAVSLGGLGALASQAASDTLFQGQTIHSSVKVTERTWPDGRVVRELWQNGGSSSAEDVATGFPAHRYAEVSAILLEPGIDEIGSALILGGAALSLPVAFERWRPEMRIDVVELDPLVTELAEEFFAYDPVEYPNISVYHDDARAFLRGGTESYDLIYLDVFDHLFTVPWTVVTVEAFDEMAARLSPSGILAANVLTPVDGVGVAFLQRLQATALESFDRVRVYRVWPDQEPNSVQNVILLATNDPDAPIERDWPEVEWGPAGRPLTDEWAPVEYLQAKVFLAGLVSR